MDPRQNDTLLVPSSVILGGRIITYRSYTASMMRGVLVAYGVSNVEADQIKDKRHVFARLHGVMTAAGDGPAPVAPPAPLPGAAPIAGSPAAGAERDAGHP